MKNRFYDAKMHGADWNAAKQDLRAAARHLVDTEELQSVMMMMIGQLNASHTGVSGGGPANNDAATRRRAIPASISSPMRPASTRSATSTRTVPPIATT